MSTKYPLHMEMAEQMLRHLIATNTDENQVKDIESLIDEMREDGYITRSVANDLQQINFVRK